ncbi:MAG: cyclic nucleotide-binding domain-containing protein [Actinomycetota bacterium]|nr:cyclic nucleotide-binding domain-containing protein [Actinomycetota bacterium]
MSGSESRAIAKQLGAYATFANCAQDDLIALADAGARFALPAEWTLVQEGIPADACYVIMEGSARVFHERAEIAVLGPGDVVGEMTLLGGGQRRATVSSVTSLRGLRVENDTLAALLTKRPQLREALTKVYQAHQGADAPQSPPS